MEDEGAEHEGDRWDMGVQTGTGGDNKERPSCDAKELTTFGSQYAQRMKHKRRQELDRLGGQKRQREETDPIELGLLRRPQFKNVASKTKQNRIQR